MPTTPTPAAAPRVPRTGLQRTDLVVGIVLTLINVLLGSVMLAQINQLPGLSAECAGIAADGARCDPGFLNAMVILGYGIVIFAGFLGVGFLIVRAVRRQIVFWVPLVAGAVILFASFNVPAIILGTSYLPAS